MITKKYFYLLILGAGLLQACQASYRYRLPSDAERQRNPADSTRWGYSGQTVISIPVVDEDGLFYKLPVTAKTKLEAKDVYGTTYKFYLQSIRVEDEDVSIGGGKLWTGYELLTHTQARVSTSELSSVSIISDEKAKTLIAIH
jgi:hypothetical protein